MTNKRLCRKYLQDAIAIIEVLGLPRAQQNERSALCLLALLNMTPGKAWSDAESPLMGITPIMDWARDHYAKDYAPNTRETVRRQSMHQLVDAGIARYNPDDPKRPVNSPYAVYQIAPHALALLKTYGSAQWPATLSASLASNQTLADKYANERTMQMVPVTVVKGKKIKLSPGDHSELIKAIVEEFAARFVPGGELIYVGDTGDKVGYFRQDRLSQIGVTVDSHGKFPDVVIYSPARDWLLLVESVTSHGLVDAKRHNELANLFKDSKAGLVYVTAFPSRKVMARYLPNISWETEVWCAESPTHLIHFNGERFLGPY